MGVLVQAAVADELAKSLGGGTEGSFELEADDGRFILPLARIVYVKRFSRETQIGFGGRSR